MIYCAQAYALTAYNTRYAQTCTSRADYACALLLLFVRCFRSNYCPFQPQRIPEYTVANGKLTKLSSA